MPKKQLTPGMLHEYQVKAERFWEQNPKCLLLLDMGLGKTVVGLTRLQKLLDQCSVGRVLIVAPKRVANKTWPDEIGKWTHTEFMTCRILTSSDVPEFEFRDYDKLKLLWWAAKDVPRAQRALLPFVIEANRVLQIKVLAKLGRIQGAFNELTKDQHFINTISRDNFARLVRLLGPANWPYDTIIVDECDSFANAQSGRFKALRSVLHKIDRIVGMTGTPTGNRGMQDLFSQVYMVDGGSNLGRSFNMFRKEYFNQSHSGFGWELKENSKTRIMGKISGVAMSMLSEDYLNLPPVTINDIVVALPDDAKSAYTEFEKEYLYAWDEGELNAASAGVLVNKLLQFSNGAVYFDPDEFSNKKEYKVFHDEKIEALRSVLSEANGEPVLIAYNYKHDRERILKAFPDVVDFNSAPDIQDRWNAGELSVVLTHPASTGHGLNLQDGGHIIVWFGLSWDLRLWQQFNKRLHRQGQKNPVIIHRILCEDSADGRVVKTLENTGYTQRELMEGLRDDIKKRLK